MTIRTANLSHVLDYWSQQRGQYGHGPYALLLCGDGTRLEKQAFEFVRQNAAMLDDMTGPYISITLVAWRLDLPVAPADASRELEYLHAAHSWALGAPGVYSLASALDLPINRLPMVMLSLDPWENDEVLLLSLRDLADSANGDFDRFGDFFATLAAACRTSRDAPPGKRLGLIRKEMRPTLSGGADATLKKVSESGVLAQIIEGVLKGLGFGG